MALETPSDCSHRPTCPGCPRFGEPGVAGDALDRLAALADRCGGVLLPTANPPADLANPFGHRHRARLMVRGRATSPKVGIFQTGSHKIADIPRCHVHHPVINRVATLLKQAIRATGTEPYAEVPHRGCVRAVQIVVERRSGRAQVVVVTNDLSPASSERLLADLEARLREARLLHSLWWNGNPERTNTILGRRFECMALASGNTDEQPESEGWLRESIGSAEVFFPPAAFGQSHLKLADVLVERVHEFAKDSQRVSECYAGCGSIGLGLLARGAQLAFNEQNPAGIAGLERGIDELDARARVTLSVGAAGECLEILDEAEVAIVDPPRKGLDDALLRRLATGSVARLAYVSCGLDSLERDCAALVEAGHMRLRSLEPFALFPFTQHVETLALFERS